MSTSSTQVYNGNRDEIILRAFRIVGAVGQGEPLDPTAAAEANIALNHLIKEWETDGMPLWEMATYTINPSVGQAIYQVGSGYTVNQPAPLKVLQAWNHINANNQDTPILLITRFDYNMLPPKATPGTPTQFLYDPPRAMQGTAPFGTVTLWPVPDNNCVTNGTIQFSAYKMFDDMTSSSNTFDFPQYWQNALTWGLADQLSYEYGVGLSERAMIAKKAEFHKQSALSFGTEEGSLRIMPLPSWHWESYQ